MAEIRNIVIVGGSFAGLGVAQYFFKHVYPVLKSSNSAVKYHVVMITPSTHFWWRPCAPRACVSTETLPHDQTFVSIAECLKEYDEGSAFTLHRGEATAVDTDKRTVTYKSTEPSSDGVEQAVPYHSLVIASGITTPTPMTSLHGNYTVSVAALDAMNVQLSQQPKEIVIGGGGPIGVETAGEIGNKLNGAAGLFASRPPNPQTKITLYAGGPKLLPRLSAARAAKAERFLARVGVDVVYNVRVTSFTKTASTAHPTDTKGDTSRPSVHLSDGTTLTPDIYIPATGGTPNTAFLPPALLDGDTHRVAATPALRVAAAGPRVYALGDACAAHPADILALHEAVPVLGYNLGLDLGVQAERGTFVAPDADPANHETTVKARERAFRNKNGGETQLVPIGWKKGVGAFNGWDMPALAVWGIKGRNYMIGFKGDFTEGKKFAKA